MSPFSPGGRRFPLADGSSAPADRIPPADTPGDPIIIPTEDSPATIPGDGNEPNVSPAHMRRAGRVHEPGPFGEAGEQEPVICSRSGKGTSLGMGLPGCRPERIYPGTESNRR